MKKVIGIFCLLKATPSISWPMHLLFGLSGKFNHQPLSRKQDAKSFGSTLLCLQMRQTYSFTPSHTTLVRRTCSMFYFMATRCLYDLLSFVCWFRIVDKLSLLATVLKKEDILGFSYIFMN